MRIEPPSGSSFSNFGMGENGPLVQYLKSFVQAFLDRTGGAASIKEAMLELKNVLSDKNRDLVFSVVDQSTSLAPYEKTLFKEGFAVMQKDLAAIEEAMEKLSDLEEKLKSVTDPVEREAIQKEMANLNTLIDTKRADLGATFENSIEIFSGKI